jgi:N-acetyl-gamma-glutamylphosphate reductase
MPASRGPAFFPGSRSSRARALGFSEPNAERLAREAQEVFCTASRRGAEYAVPLLEGGCQVIDLSADFRF